MNLQVVKIDTDGFAEFTTSFGVGLGVWVNSEVPVSGNYYAEFNITTQIYLGQNAVVVPDQRPSIKYHDVVNVIIALVESRDEDGMTFLRLAKDCLAMIECESELLKDGDCVQIRVDALDLEIYGNGPLPDIKLNSLFR